jgi:hypothetical protein
MGQIVEENNFVWTVNLAEQTKHLAPEATGADNANPLRFVR